jgi:predicted nucleotidyltransferase
VPEPEFQPERMFQVLEKHGVRFVLIGGFAAVIHGSPYVTTDIDLVPESGLENLDRLSEALRAMNARVWSDTEPDGVPFDHDAASMATVRIWNLVTDLGRLDLTFEPAGTSGYEDLVRGATRLEISGTHVDVATLADVIRSKEAAGRDKDRLVLPVLRRLLGALENEERQASREL